MNNETVNFTELVKLNNTTLPTNVQDKLIVKLNETFQESEQRWYAANLYLYLNFHPTNDYPIDLENVYSMIGFANKENAKRTLSNNFNLGVDYRVQEGREVNFAPPKGRAKNQVETRGGSNKEIVLLNTDTFKDLCMISRTEKGKEIRKYYLKLESISNEIVKNIIDDLNNKLIQNSKETAVKIRSKEEKLIDQFPEDKMCIYIADIGFINGVHLVKFGESNNLKQRVASHRNTFENFELVSAYEVFNSRKFEKMLKEVPEIKYRLKHTVVKDHNRQEIMFVDENYTLEDLNKEIKSLIEKHCTLENCLADIELRKEEYKTKQMEIELRKIELQEKTKQMEIELKIQELKNKSEIPQQQPIRNRGMKSKAEESKEVFTKWLSENIIISKGDFLKMENISLSYLGHSTSTQVIRIYRNYLEEYLSENCPSVNNKYIQKAKIGCGYRDIKLKFF